MEKVDLSLRNIHLLDDLAGARSPVHSLDPPAKMLVAMAFIITVASFGRYELVAMVPLLLYPALIFALSGIPAGPLLKRLAAVEPFIIAVGILNPLVDRSPVDFGGIPIAQGWLSFASIMLKAALTVTAALLLISTTGMDSLAAAFRRLRLPRALVLQLLLTYRYVATLMEEISRAVRAYKSRSPSAKGVAAKHFGALAGRVLMRTADRAERIYQAMLARGFDGEYRTGGHKRAGAGDWAFAAGWIAYFILVRMIDIPLLIGGIL